MSSPLHQGSVTDGALHTLHPIGGLQGVDVYLGITPMGPRVASLAVADDLSGGFLPNFASPTLVPHLHLLDGVPICYNLAPLEANVKRATPVPRHRLVAPSHNAQTPIGKSLSTELHTHYTESSAMPHQESILRQGSLVFLVG